MIRKKHTYTAYLTLLITLLFISASMIYPQSRIQLFGEPGAGNVVAGKAENIKSILFDNKNIGFDEEGYFIIGFDRDSKGKHLLKVTFKDKKSETREFVIEQAEYETQRINGMKRSLVVPPKKASARINKETKIISAQKKKYAATKTAYFKTGFALPIDSSEITSVFGSGRVLNGIKRDPHNGVDFNAPEGREVKAAGDGIVILAESNFYYNGSFVMINHGFGLITHYLHLSKVDVKRGNIVKKGDLIGEVGSTGRSTGPHLHWGVTLRSKRIDPLSLLKLNL